VVIDFRLLSGLSHERPRGFNPFYIQREYGIWYGG
jgi:hypothetical protein